MVTLEMIRDARVALHDLVLNKWLTTDLFSLRWFGMVVFIIFSYILCFMLIDKKWLGRILLFGSLFTVGMSVYETVGVSFVLWYCATPVLPVVPCLFASDLTIAPLYYMIVFQKTSAWKDFFIWNLVAAGIFAFAYQPVVAHFKIFELDNWNFVFTFISVFLLSSLARFATLWILSVENRHRDNGAA